MMKAAIVLDDWKLSIFERHLTEAGYTFEKFPGVTNNTLTLKVPTLSVSELGEVVKVANTEAICTGGGYYASMDCYNASWWSWKRRC